jgi:CheY-like chemotaxis protein
VRVLLIEDHPGDARLFELAAGEGYTVERARTLADALRALRSDDPPTLIVADLHLPDAGPDAVLEALWPYRESVAVLAKVTDQHPIPQGWRGSDKGDGTWPSYREAVRSLLPPATPADRS